MDKQINYGVWVIGTENSAKVVYSDGMTHLQKYALLQNMLEDCFLTSIEGVPDEVKNNIIEKMITDARNSK